MEKGGSDREKGEHWIECICIMLLDIASTEHKETGKCIHGVEILSVETGPSWHRSYLGLVPGRVEQMGIEGLCSSWTRQDGRILGFR